LGNQTDKHGLFKVALLSETAGIAVCFFQGFSFFLVIHAERRPCPIVHVARFFYGMILIRLFVAAEVGQQQSFRAGFQMLLLCKSDATGQRPLALACW
jgi:hypothetical protein